MPSFATSHVCSHASQDDLVLRRILFKLFNIQKSLEEHAHAIREQNKALAGLRQEQRKHEKALEVARSEQAKARGNVMQKEKRIKKAEKALETKVRGTVYEGRCPC